MALDVTDEQGHHARVHLQHRLQPAQGGSRSGQAVAEQLRRLGGTVFVAGHVQVGLSQPWFVPAKVANRLRRGAVVALLAAREAALERLPRAQAVQLPAPCPDDSLSYLASVYNHKAAAFYARHGVKLIEAAYESHEALGDVSLMITKHCVRWSLSLCPKQAKGAVGVQGTVRAEPLTLQHGDDTLTLRFDCKPCEMRVVGRLRKNVLQRARREAAAAPMPFYRTR